MKQFIPIKIHDTLTSFNGQLLLTREQRKHVNLSSQPHFDTKLVEWSFEKKNIK